VFQMLYARDDSVIPAAFLQLPPEVTVLVDPAAAQKL
jgi:6-phosphogluconolactonase/glucosamine-6-phosphate isomerase/deaminase